MDIAKIIGNRAGANVITCDVNDRVRQAAAILAENRIGALPVMDGGKLAGIFSERDVIYRLAEFGPSCLERTVGEVMTAEPITVDLTTKVDDALALMTRKRIRHLPVMDGGAMSRFISIGDLVKSRIDQVENEAAAMRDYIQGA